MSDDNREAKKTEKLAKLLRLASPSSGAPEPERISAALAAAELFTKLEEENKDAQREAGQRATAAKKARYRPPGTDDTYDPSAAQRSAYVPPNGNTYTSTPMGPRGGPFVEAWHRSRSSVIYLRCQNPNCKLPIGINQPVWRRVNDGQVEWLHENCPRSGFTGL